MAVCKGREVNEYGMERREGEDDQCEGVERE